MSVFPGLTHSPSLLQSSGVADKSFHSFFHSFIHAYSDLANTFWVFSKCWVQSWLLVWGVGRRVGEENHQVHPQCKGKWLRPSVHILSPPPHHGQSICVLFLCLFHPSLGRGLCTPTHQQPFPALLSSASFDPFVKRLLEASEPLATLATSSPGLVIPAEVGANVGFSWDAALGGR